jgi:hypothetical protein
VIAPRGPAQELAQGSRATGAGGDRKPGWRRWSVLALLVVVSGLAFSGCTRYHGPLTNLGLVDQYPAGRWYPTPAANQVRTGLGIYHLSKQHLILVHIQIPDYKATSLGPGAVHGAVGVWWVALDDRVSGDSSPVWQPSCVRYKTASQGSEFDVIGDYLAGPATASLSRYPLSFNPDDGSISVALDPADEISMPRGGNGNPPPYLPPAQGVTCTPS